MSVDRDVFVAAVDQRPVRFATKAVYEALGYTALPVAGTSSARLTCPTLAVGN
jgi:hypothetical protein